MSQNFYFGDVLSLITKRHLNIRGEKAIRDLIEYMVGHAIADEIPDTLWDNCVASILEQYPIFNHPILHDWLQQLMLHINLAPDDVTAWLILFDWHFALQKSLELDLFIAINPLDDSHKVQDHELLLVFGH